MDWDAPSTLQALQEFWAVAEFRLMTQDVNGRDHFYKMIYLSGPTGIEAWKLFTWEGPTGKEDPSQSLQ